jgi:hypothetical protein
VRGLSACHSHERAGKEAEAVRVGTLLSAASFNLWRMALQTAISAASGRGDAAFERFDDVSQNGSATQRLQINQGFERLDAKLLASLVRASAGTVVAGEIARVQQTASVAGRCRKCCQALWLIYALRA